MINPNTFVKETMPESFFVTFYRPLFRDASGTLDKNARFSPLYRQDSNKLSNEDVLRLLADFRKLVKLWCLFSAAQMPVLKREAVSHLLHVHTYHWSTLTPDNSKNRTQLYFTSLRPEKMAKLPVILGNLDVTIDNVAPDLTSKTRSVPERWEPSVFPQGCLFNLPSAPVHRLCYLILHSCEAVWRRREGQHLLWSGGVCAVHSQMLSAFHHLQQSPLCLPETLEVWQSKVIREGIRQRIPRTCSSSSCWNTG